MSEIPTQVIARRFLCRCGANAAVSIQFPYEQAGYFCEEHAQHQPRSKEIEPGRAMVATVASLTDAPVPESVAIQPTGDTATLLAHQAEMIAAKDARILELEAELELATAPLLSDGSGDGEQSSRVD